MPLQLPIAFLGCIVIINVAAFMIMLRDKRLSMRHDNSERIPEGILFFMATIFGSVGIYLGMFVFRHKTRKWYFVVGIPCLIIQNLTVLYLMQTIINWPL